MGSPRRSALVVVALGALVVAAVASSAAAGSREDKAFRQCTKAFGKCERSAKDCGKCIDKCSKVFDDGYYFDDAHFNTMSHHLDVCGKIYEMGKGGRGVGVRAGAAESDCRKYHAKCASEHKPDECKKCGQKCSAADFKDAPYMAEECWAIASLGNTGGRPVDEAESKCREYHSKCLSEHKGDDCKKCQNHCSKSGHWEFEEECH